MSVIIRLQNLPWSANALDIRQFFSGLSIPEGGVHIVGGELGDAFIAFSTDEDARQAFNLNGGKIKEIQIKLMLSSRTEMQKVIEAARNPLAAFMHQRPVIQPLLPAAIPPLMSETRKDDGKDKGKRDRRRSRSRSRDRKDRSRERDRRDRRRRDRSRSRSRDRRDRRRKDRSVSRERRSKDNDRRSKDRRRSEEKSGLSSNSNSDKELTTKSWDEQTSGNLLSQQQQALPNSFLGNNMDDTRRNLNSMMPPAPFLQQGNRNSFQSRNDGFDGNLNRDNWNSIGQGMGAMDNRPNFIGHGDRQQVNEPFQSGNRQMQNQFGDNQGTNFNRLMPRSSRFDAGSPSMSFDRPSLLDLPRSEFNKNCCISLRPYYGGYGEIRRFFQGIFIHNTGIKFVNDDNGRRTGIVHIRFATPDGKMDALQRNGIILKNNRMEIIHIEDNVFDATVDRYRPDFKSDLNDGYSLEQFRGKSSPNVFKNNVPTNFTCIAVEDLPLFTKEQDMLKIFSDYSMISCWLINHPRHIVAFIKFANPDDAKKAITEKAKFTFDGKPLEIRPCSDEEYASVNQDEIQEILDDEEDKDAQVDKQYIQSDCVSLNGLPLKTNDRDISDFFSDVAIVPTNIHLVNSSAGFTGQAFCEFASAADAEIALEKNGLPLGSGTVEVESVLRSDMEEAIRGNSGINLNCNGPPRPMYNRGFGNNFGPRGLNLMGSRPPMRRPLPTPVNPLNLGSKGCTLLMENVPYKAGLNEILEFFDSFDIPPDNVLRRYNENGTPSGEAKVIFTSPQDAFRALQERHHKKIRDRPIYLSQC